MEGATKLAFGVAALWIAGVLLFIAFHPGGVIMADGKSAGNPVDVFKWIIGQRGTLGDFGKAVNSDGSITASSPAAGSVPQPTPTVKSA